MSIISRPDFSKIFASEAKTGELKAFPDINRGWGITLEVTAGKPPMEWFNAAGKRVDEWLLYLTQRGIAEWDIGLSYPKYALIQDEGIYYVSQKATTGEKPNTTRKSWKTLADSLDLKEATVTQKGIVQLSSATDSDSESVAATSLAVKLAMDNANCRLPTEGTAIAAARLAKPQKIAGVDFDGSSPISIPAGNVNAYTKSQVDSAISAKANKNQGSTADSGWWRCGSTGIIYQWGSVWGKAYYDVDFPIRFPNKILNAFANCDGLRSANNFERAWCEINIQGNSLYVSCVGPGPNGGTEYKIRAIHWFAIGY